MRVYPFFDSWVTDGQTDKASYRVACPQLKRKKEKKERKRKKEKRKKGVKWENGEKRIASLLLIR